MIVKKYVLVRACMSFECTEEFSVSSYGAAYMYIRQLEPYHVPPFSLPPSLTISGATAAVPKVFLFVAGFVTTKRASGGRTDTATVARGGGEEQWRRSLRQRQRRWNEVKASSQFVRQRRWRIRFLLPRSVVFIDNTKFLTQFHILMYSFTKYTSFPVPVRD